MRSLLYTTDASSNSSYTGFSGTSAAVPVASGGAALAIALVKSRGYAVKASEIENLLLQSARKVSTLKNYFRDGNALNLANLARLIDQKYPPRGAGLDVSDVDGDPSDRDQASECPAI
jgi:subtilisin family serine protease